MRHREALLLRASAIIGTAESLTEGLHGLVDTLLSLRPKTKTVCSVLLAKEEATAEGLVLRIEAVNSSASLRWKAASGRQVRVRDWPALQRMLESGRLEEWKGSAHEQVADLRRLSQLLGSPQAIACALLVPLKIGNRILGQVSLGVFSSGTHTFSKEERELVVAIAAQAAALIQRIHLLEATERRERRLERLERVRSAAEQLAQASHKRDVHKRIASTARSVLEADVALLWVYDSWRKRFIPEDSEQEGLDPGAWRELLATGLGDEGMSYRIVEESRVVGDVADLNEGQRVGSATRQLLRVAQATRFQGFVLRVGEEILGVIYALYRKRLTLGEGNAEVEAGFANYAALVLNKARLYDQLQKALGFAQAMASLSVLDSGTVLQSIARSTQEVLGCDSVVLFEYNLRQQNIRYPPTMVGVTNLATVSLSQASQLNSIVYMVLDLEAPLMVDDVSQDPDFHGRSFAREEGIKSIVAIPLRARDLKIGVMFVNFRSLRRFTQADVEHVTLFANQAAVAIYNAQLFDGQRKQTRERSGLIELSRELLNTNSVRVAMDRAVAATAKMLDTEFCDIVFRDRDGILRVRAAVGWDSSALGLVVESGERSLAGYTVLGGEPVLVNDFQSLPSFLMQPSIRSRLLRSALSVPMLQSGQIVGAMLVYSMASNHFSQEDTGLLTLAANHIAIAIRSAEQYDRGMRVNMLLQALYDVAKALTSDLELNRRQVLDQIVQPALTKITGGASKKASFATIQVYDAQSHELVIESAFALQDHQQRVSEIGQRRSLNAAQAAGGKIGIPGRAVLTRTTQLVADVTKSVDYLEVDAATRSELAVPLCDAAQVLGVINIESREIAAFDEYDQIGLESLAELVVVALKREAQVNELQRTKHLVGARTAIAWMGMASSDWYHAVAANISALRTQVKLLRSETSARKIKDRLRTIDRLAQQCIHRSEMEGLQDYMIVIRLNALVRDWSDKIFARRPELKKRIDIKFNLELHDEVMVKASPLWLIRILDLLLDNAATALLQHGDQKGERPKPWICISSQLSGDLAAISIEDNGLGIDTEIRDRLFLFPIESWKTNRPGSTKRYGIGLMIAQAIAEAYGGHMGYRPIDGGGTRMTLYLRPEG